MVVTHPFHPLRGEELPVLFSARMKGVLVFVCESDGGKRRVSLPQSWTDRGPEAMPDRFAVDGLTAARALVDALASRLSDDTEDAR
ncbi:DUF5372 family protein [Solwaraspora sp. WMMD1047]|uniref:DUF5372 family protein n=1 Tax=Solwaraspora sp. WMMD1047 TaxID=3016102 RepID=UPI00241739F0|nr:DUF5372 family protein [Solwaraspora sp. WMMD1047]MDG4829969.1 DUF5372 family protein [Solwaraspora sp. WMMD1047]